MSSIPSSTSSSTHATGSRSTARPDLDLLDPRCRPELELPHAVGTALGRRSSLQREGPGEGRQRTEGDGKRCGRARASVASAAVG
jgi:hypothetical protein